MFMIFYCTELHLSKSNGSWVLSMKQNMDFNFQLPSTFVSFLFCFSQKWSHKKVQHFKIYQHTEFYGYMLTDASFAPTSDVRMSAILKWLKLQD
jgi:hypothetical protein